MIRNVIKKSNGLTLLETIISVALFFLIATAICFVFNRSLFVFRSSTDKNAAVQEASIAAEWLVRDIGRAGPITVAQTNEISMEMHSSSPGGITEIHYYRDGNQNIQRQDTKPEPDVDYLLAEGVTGLSFGYYDENNVDLGSPVGDISQIKLVEINITIQKNAQEFKLNTVASLED